MTVLSLRNRRAFFSRQGGQTLLETAIVLPFILGLVLAAVDINSYLRTKSALQEGLTTALRCAYPADGECISASSNFAAEFDVETVTYSEIPGRDTFTFGFRQNFLTGPELEVQGFDALTIGNGTANYNYFRNQIRALRVNATGEVTSRTIAVARSFVPFLTGGSPQNPANATFNFKGAGGAYPDINLLNTFERGNAVEVTANGGAVSSGWTTVFAFDVPAPPVALRDPAAAGMILAGSSCLLDTSVDNENDNVNSAVTPSTNRCRQDTLIPDTNASYSGLPNNHPHRYRVPAVFHLQGLTATSNMTGTTNLRIREVATGRTASLGGRQYSGSDSNASFYPRGARTGYYETSSPPNEYTLGYNDNVLLKYGHRYRVQVNVTANGTGTFAWELKENNGLRVYMPTYVSHQESIQGVSGNCTNASGQTIDYRPSEIGAYPSAGLATCHFTHENRSYEAQSLSQLGQPFATGGNITINDTPNQISGSVPSSLLQQSAATSGVSTNPIDWQLQSSQNIQPAPHNYSCGANNGLPGLDGLSSVDGNLSNGTIAGIVGSFCPSPSAQTLGITTAETSGDVFINNYSFAVVQSTHSIPVSERAPWGQPECGDLSLPAGFQTPASAAAYPSHELHPAVVSSPHGNSIYNTGGQNPFDLVVHDSRYNCGDYLPNEGPSGPDAAQRTTLSNLSSTLLVPHIGEYCQEQLSGSVGQGVSAQFVSELQLEAGSYLEVFENFVETLGYPNGVPAYDAACANEGKIKDQVVATQYLGRYTEEQLPPTECTVQGVSCVTTFAGVTGGDSGPQLDLQKAVEYYGANEVMAFNPRAEYGCTGANCFDMQLDTPDPNTGMIQGTATAEVSLITLGGATVPVSVSARERWEGTLLK